MLHIQGTAEVRPQASVELGAKAHAETECTFKITSVNKYNRFLQLIDCNANHKSGECFRTKHCSGAVRIATNEIIATTSAQGAQFRKFGSITRQGSTLKAHTLVTLSVLSKCEPQAPKKCIEIHVSDGIM